MALVEGERKRARRAGGRRRRPAAAGSTQAEPRPPASPSPEGGFLPDLLRRGLSLGVSGFYLTEEAVRRALGDKVPREWLEFFVAQSDRTRNDLVDALSREFGRVLAGIDPADVLRLLLDGQTVEITAQIRLQGEPRDRTARAGRAAGTPGTRA
jgi:hypothetical protein